MLTVRVNPEDESKARAVSMLAQKSRFENLAKLQKQLKQEVENRLQNRSELLFASRDGNLAVVRECLRNWANPNYTNEKGQSAIFVVFEGPMDDQRLDILHDLLRFEADVARDQKKSILSAAIAQKHSRSVQLLLRFGARHQGKIMREFISEDLLQEKRLPFGTLLQALAGAPKGCAPRRPELPCTRWAVRRCSHDSQALISSWTPA